jgi:hypothetical protein
LTYIVIDRDSTKGGSMIGLDWMDQLLDGSITGLIDRFVSGYLDDQMDGWLNGRIYDCMDGWINGWFDD